MSGIDLIVYGILLTFTLIGTTEFVIGLLLLRKHDKLQEEKENKRLQVKARKRMRIFKSVDEKLKEIGFNKTREDKYGATYERYIAKYDYWQRVDIWHKASGRHILQSYDRDLMDEKKIGNTCVGLTGYEMSLFVKKMKKLGLYSRTAGIER